MKRRDFLETIAAVPVAGAAKSLLPTGPVEPFGAANGSFRFVHLTDTHVFSDKNCPALARKCIHRLHDVAAKADLIVHGGDVIFDALRTGKDEVARQWKLWKELEAELPKKPRYVLGNHDVWAAADASHAKDWALEQLGLERRYYRFDAGEWRFLVLDSIQPKPGQGGWYTAAIDPEQRHWLEGELAGAPKTTPIAIVSHIPILSAAIIEWAQAAEGNWSVSSALMHADSHELQTLFRGYPNVKLCISGHLHLLDQVTYDGIDYLGSGAACGDWWKADTFHQTHCGFASFELHPDGTYRRQYHPYQWT